MSVQCEVTGKVVTGAPISFFERYLTLWVFLCILAGIVLGKFAPAVFQAVGRMEVAQVNLPVGVLIWVMIIPMLMKIDFGALHEVRQQKASIGVTLFVNWAIKPFTMALMGWIFIRHVFAPWLPAAQLDSYIAGLILLGAAPCTAMVFVWSNLCRGNANFTLTQVALNDLVMVVAFAPIVALLLGVTEIAVPWETLLLSVVLYVVLPLAAGLLTRRALGSEATIHAFTHRIKPVSILGLIATVVILFSLQGSVILENPAVIALIAVPILIQSYMIFGLAYGAAWFLRVPHAIAAPCAMIGTSNFFELAVAVAISLFGLQSGAALATVVGVLVEVPVMLSLVALANRTRAHFPQR